VRAADELAVTPARLRRPVNAPVHLLDELLEQLGESIVLSTRECPHVRARAMIHAPDPPRNSHSQPPSLSHAPRWNGVLVTPREGPRRLHAPRCKEVGEVPFHSGELRPGQLKWSCRDIEV